MRRQRLTAFRKAALGLIACGSLLVLADGASAQSDNTATDPVVRGLTNCGLGKTTKNLHVLVVLDESGSLKGHDPGNKRVEGTVNALEALKKLADRFGDDLYIDVAIHGFSGGQATTDMPYRDENPWLTFDDFDDLINDAKGFTSRNAGLYTDYRKAIEGAIQAFDDRDPDQKGCKLLVWFTDGVYDSENNTALTVSEIAEITDELCIADGLVDQLREKAITTIAIGLSNKATGNPPDLTLVETIANGDTVAPENPDLELPNEKCGTRPGTGDLYEEDDPSQLIATFEELLGDLLFEVVEELPPPLPCTPDANVCTVEFELGPWVDRFTAYFKLPPRINGRGLTASLDPPGVDTAPVDITYPKGALPGLPGLEGESPSRSWRKLTGTAEDASDIWNGVWQIHFEGPGAAKAKANLQFIEGNLEVLLDQRTLDRTDPDTFKSVKVELKAGGRTVGCSPTGSYPIILEFTGSMGGQSARPKCLRKSLRMWPGWPLAGLLPRRGAFLFPVFPFIPFVSFWLSGDLKNPGLGQAASLGGQSARPKILKEIPKDLA